MRGVQTRHGSAEDGGGVVVLAAGRHGRQRARARRPLKEQGLALMGQNPRRAVAAIPGHQRRSLALLLIEGDFQHGRGAVVKDWQQVAVKGGDEGLAIAGQPPAAKPGLEDVVGHGARERAGWNLYFPSPKVGRTAASCAWYCAPRKWVFRAVGSSKSIRVSAARV